LPEVGVVSAGRARPGAGHPAATSHRWRDWLTLVVPAAAAWLVAGYHLGKLSLWRDEAYSLEASRRSFGQILALLHHKDAVNGTYYLFMHVATGLLGTSESALRLPSLIAIAVAAAATTALARLLARLAGLPAPWLTGLLAGLLLAVAPQATRYAQNARAYTIVTMLVVIATYLLVRAMMTGGWWWWAGYALAITAAGLFNLFSLLMVAAHGLTVLLTHVLRRRGASAPAGPGPATSGAGRAEVTAHLWRWLVAVAAVGILLSPLGWLGFEQRGQVNWLTKPRLQTIYDLFVTFAGSKPLIIPIVALALCGSVAGFAARSRPAETAGPAVPAGGPAVPAGGRASVAAGPATLAVVTLPWLIVPPVVLLAISLVKPVYDVRYVFYCQPALAVLCAAGLAWLARLTARALPGDRGQVLAWLPSAAILALLGVLLVAPQRAVRLPSSRPDNLRFASAVIAAHGRPSDIVFYIPWNMRVLGMGYPAPFRRLRDISLETSPLASNTLLGTQVNLATFHHRLRHVSRVWLVTAVSQQKLLAVTDPVQRAELAYIHGMRLIGRWHAGVDVLSLYRVR
jgi:mannosyltransferase